MKTAFGIRLVMSLLIGALLAGVWLYFFFDAEPRKLEPIFSLLVWQGTARILVALAAAFLITIGFQIGVAFIESKNPALLRKIALFRRSFDRAVKRKEIPQIVLVAGWFLLIALACVTLLPMAIGLLILIFQPAGAAWVILARTEWLDAVSRPEWQERPREFGLLLEIAGRIFSGESTTGVFWIFGKGLIIPVLLFLAPYVWIEQMEKLSEHPLFRRLFVHGRGGSARWAGLRGFDSRRAAGSDNLFMGRTTYWDAGFDHGKEIGLGDDAHMLTIGCTGSGKSVTVIWPNLARYEGGIVILDPKGEHAKMTYWRRTSENLAAGKCQHTTEHFTGTDAPRSFKLDPFNQEPSIPPSHYNPLSEIDIDDDRVLEKLAAISDGCVLPEGEKNQHWAEGSRTILEGVMAHVLSREPEENRNLPYVHDLLLGFDRTTGAASTDQLAALLAAMQENPVAGGICQKATSYIAHDTRGTMMTTVLRSIKWMGDPSMRKHLAQPSDFKFADVPKFGTAAGNTVYVVAPIGPLMKEQVRWLRVLTNLSITIIRLCRKPTQRTLFILDEFPQLQGKLTAVEEGIVTLRSAHVRLWPFIQQIGQLKKDYGANWNTFISSSNIQAFGVTDPETAAWLSEGMLGDTLHFRREGRRLINEGPRPLLTAREIMTELGKNEPRAIVIPNDGGFPMRLERMAYKPMVIEGKRFKGLMLDGCFEEPAE